MKTIQINPADNVIVALEPLAAGTAVAVPGVGDVAAAEDIPQGHKMAVRAIAAGDNVIKYGLPIGHVTCDVQAGSWLHTHNVKTNLSGEVDYECHPSRPVLRAIEPKTFQGFRRADGRAATRNELWIIPTVGCVNEVARAMCEQAQDLVGDSLEGVYYFPHPFGCSQTGADHAQTRKLLVALSRHANAAGVLFLSLGCENCTHAQVLEELGDYDAQRVRFLTCQDVEDELVEGHKILSELATHAKTFKREAISASELVIGLKCGGSDGLSGITDNPVIGRVSDIAVAGGGTSVLTEVPEMFGAESILLDRCETRGNVFFGIDYLVDPSSVAIGQSVAVIGAGNVAMDVARTALRQGARNVTIYARSKHVSASSDEVEFAQLDGAELVYGKAIKEIDGNGPVFRTAIFDEEDAVVGYEDELDHVSCDTVVIAASQQAKDKLVLTTDALVANDRGLLEVDENGMTMMPGVFAAGDVVSGPSTVVHAVAGANRAIAGIMSYLGI